MVILTWQLVLKQIWDSPVTNEVRRSNLWTLSTNTIGSWPTMSVTCVVPNPDGEDGCSLWNAGVFEPPNMAVSLRWFYWILLPQKLQDIYFNFMIKKITSTMRSCFLEHGRLMSFFIRLWQVGYSYWLCNVACDFHVFSPLTMSYQIKHPHQHHIDVDNGLS
jgi:hypothetical protein